MTPAKYFYQIWYQNLIDLGHITHHPSSTNTSTFTTTTGADLVSLVGWVYQRCSNWGSAQMVPAPWIVLTFSFRRLAALQLSGPISMLHLHRGPPWPPAPFFSPIRICSHIGLAFPFLQAPFPTRDDELPGAPLLSVWVPIVDLASSPARCQHMVGTR